MKLSFLFGVILSVAINMSFSSPVDASGIDNSFSETISVEMHSDFLAAARKGNIDKVKDLIQRGADIDTFNEMGITALMWAAMEGRADLVKLLVNQGADVNMSTKTGNTALIWAASNNHTDIIETLLQHGADINAANKHGETALILASSKKHTESMMLLLYHGADSSIIDANGKDAAQCMNDWEPSEDGTNTSYKKKNHCCIIN